MGTFEELVDRLAAALDEAAEGIRDALRSRGRPQKFLANRVADASPSLISRWLSGARQLSERNRLPGPEAMRQIAAVLELPPQRARELTALGERIDELRTRLESEERGWRARAAEYRDRADALPPSSGSDAFPPRSRPDALPPSPSGALPYTLRPDDLPPPSGSDALPSPSRPGALPPQSRPVERRTVPLMTAAIAAATAAVISFLGGMLAGRSWAGEPPPATTVAAAGQGAGERCSPWTDAGDGVHLEACVRVRDGRMLIRNRLRGPAGTRADMVVQGYDTFLEKPVTKELKCHQMHLTAEGQVQTCGWHEIRPPYGSEYATRAGWRKAGEGPFGGHVLSPGLHW
ncbi:MAG TPA: hypothetical protein VKZ82_12210 [Nonomuraea sp.]|nr:hypothetical protein [Nonomuraea sp.]